MHDCSCEGLHEIEEAIFKLTLYATIISIVVTFVIVYLDLKLLISYSIFTLIASFCAFVVMLRRRYFLF